MKAAGFFAIPLLAACGATPTPDRAELSEALRRFSDQPVAPLDVSHIACLPASDDAFVCRWRQREDRRWHDWRGRLAVEENDWRLAGRPWRRP